MASTKAPPVAPVNVETFAEDEIGGDEADGRSCDEDYGTNQKENNALNLALSIVTN